MLRRVSCTKLYCSPTATRPFCHPEEGILITSSVPEHARFPASRELGRDSAAICSNYPPPRREPSVVPSEAFCIITGLSRVLYSIQEVVCRKQRLALSGEAACTPCPVSRMFKRSVNR